MLLVSSLVSSLVRLVVLGTVSSALYSICHSSYFLDFEWCFGSKIGLLQLLLVMVVPLVTWYQTCLLSKIVPFVRLCLSFFFYDNDSKMRIN